jgi:protein O-mannosyl-transferase
MDRESRSTNRRNAEPRVLDQRETTAFAAVDRPVQSSAPRVHNPYTALAVCGFLLLAVAAVFGQTAYHRFIYYDDPEYICWNSHVTAGLTSQGVAWAMTTFHAYNWHPLTWLSHMLDCELYGLEPGGHHLTNVIWHAASAILLFLSLRRMTNALWPSAWVAAVFAIHPLRVESVAWVSERKDVLSGFFFMLTLWFYARYVERPKSWGRYLLVAASFALGLTAKPMLVTLPFVLLLLDYWPLGRLGPLRGASRKDEADLPEPDRRLGRLLLEKIPLFVLAAASCVVTLIAQRGAMRTLKQLDLSERLANAAVAYVAYLGKMLHPAELAVYYPLPRQPLPAGEVIAAVTLLLTISTTVFAVRRTCPYLLFGWVWYLGTLVPVIGLVQVGTQKMADRYTYLTQIGLYMAIAWGAADMAGAKPYRRWGFAAVSALVLAGLMRCAWKQTQLWRDSDTLWNHTIDCTIDCTWQVPTPHFNLGQRFADFDQVDAGMTHYQMALEIEAISPIQNRVQLTSPQRDHHAAGDDQHAADAVLQSEFLAEKNDCKEDRDDNAQFVDRRDQRCIAQLQCPKIAEP